ncbi:phage tail protein I [Thiotrichales bacterium 19S3-7]|nr:phage tail protein I [Thiotrichales bacterium 19S3-7]MCF6802780.1 phage tail protein I [Thiotrichales bacterium 19S3-11]
MNHLNILPPNATKLEKSIIAAFLNQLANKDNNIRKLFSPQLCPSEFLAYLASLLSVDFASYNKADETQKRKMIKESISIHRRKGTLGALTQALAVMDYSLTVREWYEYGGQAHTFTTDVIVDAQKDINLDLKLIRNIINTNKNVQSAYIFNLLNQSQSNIYVGGAIEAKHQFNLSGEAS